MTLTPNVGGFILLVESEMKPEPMFLNCANPECAATFNFRRGRLFRFYQNHSIGSAAPVNQYSLKHFWLCKQCTEIYTLEYHEGRVTLFLLAASRLLSAFAHSKGICAA